MLLEGFESAPGGGLAAGRDGFAHTAAAPLRWAGRLREHGRHTHPLRVAGRLTAVNRGPPLKALKPAYFTRTFLRRNVGTSRSWPSTIVGSLFSKRPRVTGSNCITSCFANGFFSTTGFGSLNIVGFFRGRITRGCGGGSSISEIGRA